MKPIVIWCDTSAIKEQWEELMRPAEIQGPPTHAEVDYWRRFHAEQMSLTAKFWNETVPRLFGYHKDKEEK